MKRLIPLCLAYSFKKIDIPCQTLSWEVPRVMFSIVAHNQNMGISVATIPNLNLLIHLGGAYVWFISLLIWLFSFLPAQGLFKYVDM